MRNPGIENTTLSSHSYPKVICTNANPHHQCTHKDTHSREQQSLPWKEICIQVSKYTLPHPLKIHKEHAYIRGSEKETKYNPNWFVKRIFYFLIDHLFKVL